MLKKLAQFRGAPHADVVKRELRKALSRCDGHVAYFGKHRGIEIYVGDETTPKKEFLIHRSPELFRPHLQRFRKERREIKPVTKNLILTQTGEWWDYRTVGGVFRMEGLIALRDHGIRRTLVQKAKKPTTPDSYVGIELEFASRLTVDELRDLVAEKRLHRSVRVINDSSIEPQMGWPHKAEVCVLSKFSELTQTLGALKPLITPEKFAVNQSCGLHVHLDARNEDVRRMYRNLACMQPLLFKLAHPERRTNRFCYPVMSPDITMPYDEDHYAAISKSSYRKHRSIEVRIHESTLDLGLVEKWARLLKTIADYRGELDFVDDDTARFSGIPDPLTHITTQFKERIRPPAEILTYVEAKLA